MSLLDGKVVAVDKDTGRQLWTFDSGPPLLSVSGTADDKQDTEDSSARSPVHSVIPSVHGKLYGYRQQGPFTRGLEVLLKPVQMSIRGIGHPCKALPASSIRHLQFTRIQ